MEEKWKDGEDVFGRSQTVMATSEVSFLEELYTSSAGKF